MEKKTEAICPCQKFLSGGIQHILDEDTITTGGVIHQHMGHGTHDFAVLNDGAAGHE